MASWRWVHGSSSLCFRLLICKPKNWSFSVKFIQGISIKMCLKEMKSLLHAISCPLHNPQLWVVVAVGSNMKFVEIKSVVHERG